MSHLCIDYRKKAEFLEESGTSTFNILSELHVFEVESTKYYHQTIIDFCGREVLFLIILA